jgi:hypothetical protein
VDCREGRGDECNGDGIGDGIGDRIGDRIGNGDRKGGSDGDDIRSGKDRYWTVGFFCCWASTVRDVGNFMPRNIL